MFGLWCSLQRWDYGVNNKTAENSSHDSKLLEGAGRQRDAVSLSFVGKYGQKAIKLIQTLDFMPLAIVLQVRTIRF